MSNHGLLFLRPSKHTDQLAAMFGASQSVLYCHTYRSVCKIMETALPETAAEPANPAP